MTSPRYADASARCAGAKPNALLRSSAGAGWTNLLLDHHEGRGHDDVFEMVPDVTENWEPQSAHLKRRRVVIE